MVHEADWITIAYLLTAVNRGGVLFSSILAPCFSKASTKDRSHLSWSQTWDNDVRPWRETNDTLFSYHGYTY